MKTARKQGRKRAAKKNKAFGSFIIARLAPLRELAAFVTTSQHATLSPLASEVAGILEAAEGTAYPAVPNVAAERFNRLAERATLQFHAGPPVPDFPGRALIRPTSEVEIGILVAPRQGGTGLWAFQLVYGYFMNRERDRLRRCAVCRHWFVDATRNRSARRCSRACTILWSNKQRPKGGTR